MITAWNLKASPTKLQLLRECHVVINKRWYLLYLSVSRGDQKVMMPYLPNSSARLLWRECQVSVAIFVRFYCFFRVLLLEGGGGGQGRVNLPIKNKINPNSEWRKEFSILCILFEHIYDPRYTYLLFGHILIFSFLSCFWLNFYSCFIVVVCLLDVRIRYSFSNPIMPYTYLSLSTSLHLHLSLHISFLKILCWLTFFFKVRLCCLCRKY